MKKILLIDDSDTYTWCLQKYLQHRGYPVKTACTLKEARTAIQEEMPLVVCCDLDLPDGSGMDFLDEVRAADKELPFILLYRFPIGGCFKNIGGIFYGNR